MEGPRGYNAKCNKSGRERQTPRDFTYLWSLKTKINEHTKQKLTDAEYILLVARLAGAAGMGEKGEGIKMHKLPVVKTVTGA